MDKLSSLLETWNVNNILTVMNEIDRRLTIIEAINRTCKYKMTDELNKSLMYLLIAIWLIQLKLNHLD